MRHRVDKTSILPMLVSVLGLSAVIFSFFYERALAIPAFARKTGLRCTTCHESWPVLNDFGRAYRDRGYQLRQGKDDPTTAPPGFWPAAIRVTPNYEYNTQTSQETDDGKKTLKSGGFADIGMDLLTGGNLSDKASFEVVATGFSPDESANLESYWAYFSRLFFKSDWFNVRVGKHELDLPASGHRSINLTNPFLVYSYHPAADGNAGSPFALDENQRGLEVVGCDSRSFTRYTFSVFNANDSPGSRHAFDSPSAYAHVQKYFQTAMSAVPEFELGAFGAYASYPTTALTLSGQPIAGQGGNLQATMRYGGEAQIWLGSPTRPLHILAVYAYGRDKRGLYAGADRDGTWNGAFLQAIWVPPLAGLHLGLFGRYDLIRNINQPFLASERALDDQDQFTVGFKYTLGYSNRAEYALHMEYSSNRTRMTAFDGSDVRTGTAFVGIDFAY